MRQLELLGPAGNANQEASPVSQSETCAPEDAATAATVNACAHRSAPSAPNVTLITRFLVVMIGHATAKMAFVLL